MAIHSTLGEMHRLLVTALHERDPSALSRPFTVAEIYQDLVPYRQYRDELELDMNGDYEQLLLRLLAGEGNLVQLESEPALRDIRKELDRKNPNTGVYREYAAVDVRLVRAQIPDDLLTGEPVEGETYSRAQEPTLDLVRTDATGVEGSPGTEDDEGRAPPRTGMASEGTIGEAGQGEVRADDETDANVDACRWCGETLPTGRSALRFCPQCGHDVRAIPCPACGEELEPGWRFCIACGEEVGQA